MTIENIPATTSSVDDPDSFKHGFAEVNGVVLHYVEEGKGPLVLLIHGFPYLWYAWRHQIRALAEAGFRAVAPDLRGYGRSSAPDEVDHYDHTHVVGDLIALMDALGQNAAAIIGHDVGAGIANAAALMRPDAFWAVGVLCTPPATRPPVKPSVSWSRMEKNNTFYQHYFQKPEAAREMENNLPVFLLGALYSLSGSAQGSEQWRYFLEKNESIVDTVTFPQQMPQWLSRTAQDYYVDEYARIGFTGALNHYRCRDLSWENTSFLHGAVVRQPSICIIGDRDPAFPAVSEAYDNLESHMVDLRMKVVLPGIGHAPAEEAPEAVSDAILVFLRGCVPSSSQ